MFDQILSLFRAKSSDPGLQDEMDRFQRLRERKNSTESGSPGVDLVSKVRVDGTKVCGKPGNNQINVTEKWISECGFTNKHARKDLLDGRQL
jgi:hypothetical protein